jgi:hypothetical protein
MKNTAMLNLNAIASGIYLIRGKKVMLDKDLAVLYGVSTKHLKRQARRNRNRFPEDFMFELTAGETEILRCQFGTLNKSGHGEHSKYLPFAFTEHGILMLSSVLNSEKAAQINIAIMRVFLRLREMIMTNSALALHLERVDRIVQRHGEDIKKLYRRVDRCLVLKKRPQGPIGFQP